MDVFDLQATLRLRTEEFTRGLEDALNSTSVFGDVVKANLATDVLEKGMSALVSGVKKGIDAYSSLAQAAVTSYGTYEQAIGGVETLYKNAAETVKKNAAEAYETTGLSANEYMNQAITFASSVLKSITKVKKEAIDVDGLKESLNALFNGFGP